MLILKDLAPTPYLLQTLHLHLQLSLARSVVEYHYPNSTPVLPTANDSLVQALRSNLIVNLSIQIIL